jgi:CelD/BcsL family acetyltransferase involved in cellulose biosynthesis
VTTGLQLERIDWRASDWSQMDAFPDRSVFQTREWVTFLAEVSAGEPIVAALRDGSRTVGYFTGLLMRRFGIPILGSPFPGWGTDYMGFNLEPGISRRRAVEALLPYAWRTLGCQHLELRDRLLAVEDLTGLGFRHTAKTTFELDLRPDEEVLFNGLKPAVRRNIRKADRVGVVVEEAYDLGFAADYHAQLEDVFAKQGLVPPYGCDRVRALIRHLQPSGHLLLLRAMSPDGRCIATLISPAMNRTAYFWGGASWRADQHMRPNEALWWYAVRYWKRRGIEVFDFGGGGDYKRKYGPVELTIPLLRASRSRVVAGLRDMAAHGFALQQRARGQVRRPIRSWHRPGTRLPQISK